MEPGTERDHILSWYLNSQEDEYLFGKSVYVDPKFYMERAAGSAGERAATDLSNYKVARAIELLLA